MPLVIVSQDITKLKVDAIVNIAATDLQMSGSKEQDERHLRAAITAFLTRAVLNGHKTIAIPLVSSALHGYPKEEAFSVATSAIHSFLNEHDLAVTLVVDDKATVPVGRELMREVASFIKKYFEKKPFDVGTFVAHSTAFSVAKLYQLSEARTSLDDLVAKLDEPFSQTLLRLIDAKGMSDVVVYKRANLDRKLFSKIRSKKGYMPSKRTAIALAIALELTLQETKDLLERAGYALSHAVEFDMIVKYFISIGMYDVFKINEVLFMYDQPLLGG